jgi:cytochrome P450
MASDIPDPDEAPVGMLDPSMAACPHAAYQQLRDFKQGVSRMPLMKIPMITRYEDVMWALRHTEIFSSEMSEEMQLGNERPMIPQQIDPPLQSHYRRLLDPLFSRRRSLKLEPGVRREANLLIDGFIDEGHCEFNSAFAVPLPCSVFLSLFGLPHEHLDLFLEIKDGIIRPQAKTDDLEEMVKIRKDAGRQIYDYFEKEIDAREGKTPGDDLLDSFLSFEIDGEKLTRNDVLDICFLTLIAGLDTVTATLGCDMAFLAANPEQRGRLAEDPTLIPAAVEELFRWETPVAGVPRKLLEDVTLGGVEMKKGEMVTLLLGAANLDERQFDRADEVDFDRDRNRHIAFGGGPHRCLGSHLARMELRVALEEWHRRIPSYQLKPGETPTYSPGIREVQYLPLVWSPKS